MQFCADKRILRGLVRSGAKANKILIECSLSFMDLNALSENRLVAFILRVGER